MTETTNTLLIMSTIGVPLYSARGLNQTWTPVQEAKPPPRFTVNGELRFLGMSQMLRHDSVITCTDQEAPAFDGLAPGTKILVDCVFELGYLTIGGSPAYTPVSGSERTSGDHTYYRPQIEFMVVDFNQSNDEYQHDYQWQLTLRETGAGATT